MSYKLTERSVNRGDLIYYAYATVEQIEGAR